MNIHNFIESPIFYGRRKGRKLSKSDQIALNEGKRYLIKKEDLCNIFNSKKHLILEIGFGDGNNLVNSAKINPHLFYIGSDPFLNTTAKCLDKVIKYNIKNVVIWPDDVRKIINLFPDDSISAIKILFPDPWPKKKHKSRRLIQDDFLETTEDWNIDTKLSKDYIYKYRNKTGSYKGTPFNTAGWTSVEITGKIIDKIGPILATKY